MKTSQIIPKCTFIFFFLHTVLYCFHWEHQQVEGVQSAHGGSLWYEGIGQIHNWYVILKEENLGFNLNMNLSAIFEKFSNYTQVYIHIFFSPHCIVLFPLRAPASWRSAKCTRRLFMVWRNWPNSQLICYSERGEPRLSIWICICRPFLKNSQIIPKCTFILIFFSTLYCIVSTESTSKLKECKVHTEALYGMKELAKFKIDVLFWKRRT